MPFRARPRRRPAPVVLALLVLPALAGPAPVLAGPPTPAEPPASEPVRNAAGPTQTAVEGRGEGAVLAPPRPLTIAGWAVDPAAVSTAAPAGVAAVHVYLNGEAGRGQLLGGAEIGLPRPDVAGA